MSHETQFSLGPFRLNVDTGELLHAGQITKLTLKSTQLLLALAQHTGELVSKQELLRVVWKDRVVSDGSPNRNPTAHVRTYNFNLDQGAR